MGQHNYLQLKTHIIISVLLIAWSYISVSWFNTFFITCIEIVSSTYEVSVSLSSNCSFFFEGKFPFSCIGKKSWSELQFIYYILILAILWPFYFIFIKNWIHKTTTTCSIKKWFQLSSRWLILTYLLSLDT